MHRRPVGRSRLLAAIGALIALAGCFLPWWTFGGANGLPVLSGTGFESLGILVFGASIATLALVTLPYASERPVHADRWASYAIITVVVSIDEPADVVTRFPGLWLGAIGLVILARATYEMLQEPRLR